MRDKMYGLAIVIIFLAAVAIFVADANALSEEALQTNQSLQAAISDMQELSSLGLAVQRYNDTLIVAEQLYSAQSALENAGGGADYALINEKLSSLILIKRQALRTLDEIKALGTAINSTAGVENMEPVLAVYNEAVAAFEAERYEESTKKIDATYEKISEVEAVQTKVKAFYDATTRGFVSFVKNNWKEIVSIIAGLIVLFFLTYHKAARWHINRKILDLELRKKSLHDLIARTQKDYFEKGVIDENTYHTRIQRYGELMRDFNRQLPLLKEELAKHRRGRHAEYAKIRVKTGLNALAHGTKIVEAEYGEETNAGDGASLNESKLVKANTAKTRGVWGKVIGYAARVIQLVKKKKLKVKVKSRKSKRIKKVPKIHTKRFFGWLVEALKATGRTAAAAGKILQHVKKAFAKHLFVSSCINIKPMHLGKHAEALGRASKAEEAEVHARVLADFIRQAALEGQSRAGIKSSLAASGWKENIVNKYVDYVFGQAAGEDVQRIKEPATGYDEEMRRIEEKLKEL